MSETKKRIGLSEPHLAGNELKYMQQCVETNFVSSVGPFVDEFERSLASFVGTRHAVATVNGTAALHIALLVAGVQPDDEVVVSDLTFVAPANAVRYVGAWPVFIDVEPEYLQIDPRLVAHFLENRCDWDGQTLRNRATGRRVSAIVPVHILGHPCDIDPILAAAARFKLAVIEDATESLGAIYRGRAVGTLGDVACFSFNGNKIITTGGGGMIVTDRDDLAKRSRYLTTQAKDDPIEYVHHEIGYNYRLTNVLAALGVAQMEQLAGFIARKREIAALYRALLGDVPGIRLMLEADWAKSNFWLYTILVDPEQFGMDSRAVMRALAEDNIHSRPLWRPMHLLPSHQGSEAITNGTAERLYAQALSIPCSMGLTNEDVRRVADAIREIHARVSAAV